MANNTFLCQCGHGVTADKALVPSITAIEKKLGHKPSIDEIAEEARCIQCAMRVAGFIKLRLEADETIKCSMTEEEGNRMFTTAPQILEAALGRRPLQDDFRAAAVSFRYALQQIRAQGWYNLGRVVYTFENPPREQKPQPVKGKSRWVSASKAQDLPAVKEKSGEKDEGAKNRKKNADTAARVIAESAKLLEESVS